MHGITGTKASPFSKLTWVYALKSVVSQLANGIAKRLVRVVDDAHDPRGLPVAGIPIWMVHRSE